MGLVLRAVEVAGPHRWRWLLVDESSGAPLADHQVELDPGAAEVEAFADLCRFLRWRADPDRRVASEAKLLGLNLGRLAEANHLLRDCHDVFETDGDIPMLGMVYNARAYLENTRGHLQDALECERTALRLSYVHPDPRNSAFAHHSLATYLSRAAGNPAEHRAHRLARLPPHRLHPPPH